MRQDTTLVLIHSPLVGPFSWQPVAQTLRRWGWSVVVPTLEDRAELGQPFWQQHGAAVRAALAEQATDQRVLLVGHSGAGPLLPAIRAGLPQTIAGYLFVDAGLPRDGASRLDLLADESSEIAMELHATLAAGGRFPDWTEPQLREVIPEALTRQRLLAELRPRDLGFFQEPLPVFAGWPDAPCAYVQLSPVYAPYAEQARGAGWPVEEIAAGHFEMLVDPEAVARLIVRLVGDEGRAESQQSEQRTENRVPSG